MRPSRWLQPALFLLPGFGLFALVILLAALRSVWISFHDWDGMGPMTWVGFANYRELWGDPQFWVSLENNLLWLGVFLLAEPLDLGLALLVNQPIKAMRVMKSLFFMPLFITWYLRGLLRAEERGV